MEIVRDLMYFNQITKNKRIYKKNSTNISELKSMSKNNTLMGEVNHPNSFEINLGNVSHLITNIEDYSYVLSGTIKILDTPKGRILKQLVEADLVVFRPRSQGIVNPNGTVSDCKIYTFDAIPVNEDAFINPMILRGKKINKLLERMKNG